MSKSVVHLSLQIRAVSPEAVEQEAIILNFEQSLTRSLHQKEIEITLACVVELL
jgi:hypothetical protein